MKSDPSCHMNILFTCMSICKNAQGGTCLPGGGGLSAQEWGLSGQGGLPKGRLSGGCLPRGCLPEGMCLPRRVYTSPPVDRQTPVKT